MKKEVIVTKAYKIWLEGEIVRSYITVREMSVEDMKEFIEVTKMLRNKIKGKGFGLTDFGDMTKISKEARDFMGSYAADFPFEKVAAIVHNPVQRIVISFIVKLFKTDSPIKFFSNAEDAVEWLEK
jgi:hypothetical protein